MTNFRLKTYIFYEIGDSCRTEFRMRDGEYHSTEDAVVIGVFKGNSPQEAFKLKLSDSWIKNYKTDTVVAREIGKAIYL